MQGNPDADVIRAQHEDQPVSASTDARCAIATLQLLQGMTDTGSQPAAKLQKNTIGDVTAASSPQVAMRAVTPEQLQAAGEPAVEIQPSTSTSQKTSANQKEGGKKRKVALYVSYIGAGYHVSTGAGLTRQQRQRHELQCFIPSAPEDVLAHATPQ